MTGDEAVSPCVVGALLRYPVKSMLGEEVGAAEVTERGLPHDRGLALVHRESGKVASAKNPRMWRRLLTLSAHATPAAVRIVPPDGKALWSTDADVDERLSELLGQPVVLTGRPPAGAELDRAHPDEVLRHGIRAPVGVDVGRLGGAAPEGTFFDFAPLHLITSATLRRIGELSPLGAVDVARYRPNIVVDGAGAGFAENDWLGRDLRIGERLTLRVIARTPRCAVPTLAHGPLPRDTHALRVPAAHNRVEPMADSDPQPCAGVYAQVVRPGRVAVGDRLTLLAAGG
ncbi:MOSC domain-containing protein [Actinacidiphila reveromycinica]|uniref:MOSC domain-containing protein n=1 Tax=Actinacidiphila reveromycinica TaxID=659352 RepID=UPI001F0095EE|nr:MOSC domain-containing protein [Streptomyces sp. SN-593]